ncbi:GNAT family N-acetyltransferase [Oceanospirillum sediminis]|uniref:GNAT family N-acetyltransferase n=1 Tax=Oceanospirillum sediminis TaxID=2760088 RepID=A0A839INJ8_9GAMM|nr:GNAT family N-acetyltransferase [Oceanospirillum sediminis]MBB1486047.1 GNAT family N-acetyltransferase [Oceanospirillum sediminis]
MPTGRLRPATPDDAAQILQLSAALGYSLCSEAEQRQRLVTLQHSDRDQIWVYETESRLQGWIHFFQALRVASDSFIEIGGLVVSEDSRRQGIGQKLVQQAAEEAHKQQTTLRVRCNDKRKATHQFYLSCGFSADKVQQVFRLTI